LALFFKTIPNRGKDKKSHRPTTDPAQYLYPPDGYHHRRHSF